MMIVPACCLSPSDLALLGNNLLPPIRPRRTRSASRVVPEPGDGVGGHDLDAVNRSLAGHGEAVAHLYLPSMSLARAAADHHVQPAA